MVGIVIVSHSRSVAEGVAQLARGMGGADVVIEPAGGLRAGEEELGTDATLVMSAIERADSGDGVLVLMDLGSAVLSAEMALDMLEADLRRRVVLSEAPLVEGAVSAAVTARLGAPLADVLAEARAGLRPKSEHLGGQGTASPAPARDHSAGLEGLEARLPVPNRLGLHARPAATFVRAAGRFDADIAVTNLATGRGPINARSVNAVATLGVRQGHEILVTAKGPQAEAALAELRALAERGFDDLDPPQAPPLSDTPSRSTEVATSGSLTGLPVSPGIAIGKATHLAPRAPEVPTGGAEDPQREWALLERALEDTRREIEHTRASVKARAGEYSAAIFDAHLLFLEDESLLAPARRLIFEERRNAGDAWSKAADDLAARYRDLEDEYQRARGEDVAQVAGRVLAHMLGQRPAALPLDRPSIVLAPDLAPAETVAMEPRSVRGIATALGGPNSHSAILARALGIPAIAGLGEGILSVPEDTSLLLDGDAGLLYVDPPVELVQQYTVRSETSRAAARAAQAEAHQPAITGDGRRIEVSANIGASGDVAAAVSAGADGVGLLRTEFLFMDRESVPGEDEQHATYRGIAEALGGRPLILRTIDVGADKPLPYLPQPREENPFLGMRGIRLSLAEPGLLETQLRAAMRVALDHPLKIMFPMVSTMEEYRDARALVGEARKRVERAEGRSAGRVEVGIMVEVPGTALTAETFAPDVDFFSIGTNDLAQYTMAAERGNARVAALADALHPAVLRLVQRVVRAAEAHGKWVGVCGELAGDRLAAPLLVGLGVRELSMSPPAIPFVKQVLRGLDSTSARSLADAAVTLESAKAVRGLLSREAAKRLGGGAKGSAEAAR